MIDIARFSEEMKTLREFIESEKTKQMTVQSGSAELAQYWNDSSERTSA